MNQNALPLHRVILGVLILSVLMPVARLDASRLAFDSAADPAYDSASIVGVNGGYGWGGGWALGPIWTASDVSTMNSPRSSNGRAWETFARGAIPGGATRAFDGSLSPGQTFSMDFLGQSILLGGPTPSGTLAEYQIFLEDLVQVDFYPTHTHFVMPLASSSAKHVELKNIDDATALLTVTVLESPEQSGSIQLPYVPVDLLGILPFSRIAVFNNIAITPEPSGILLAPLLVLGKCLLRPRRRPHSRMDCIGFRKE
jgi:hypothetical protein